jgi:hypothetical protein
VVDRTFSGAGRLVGSIASLLGRELQDGDVGKYAWMVTAGALAVIAALTLS